MTIDIPATWRAYHHFHETWERRVADECDVLKRYAPDLVLSNISYLALEAGSRTGVPAIAYGSLAWDHILQELLDSHNPEHAHIVGHIRDVYKRAEFAIRLSPALSMDAFSHHKDVGPIGYSLPREGQPSKAKILRNSSDGPIVLVALGGVPLDSLPFHEIDQLAPFQLILDMPLPFKFSRLRSSSQFDMSFMELFDGADIILSKPGYGTVIEAVASGTPIIYVRRYNFADEDVLVEYAHRYGRAMELSKDEFYAGSWQKALTEIQALPLPREAPPESGVSAAADVLDPYL